MWGRAELPRMQLACRSGHPCLQRLVVKNKMGIMGLNLQHLPALQYVECKMLVSPSLPRLVYLIVEPSLMTRETPVDLHVQDFVLVMHGTKLELEQAA